jgi:hypothetical protein
MKKNQRTYQSVDSDIVQDRVVNIHEMATSAAEQHLAQSYINLEKKAIALSETINNLLKQLDSKEEEIQHLKQLLNSSTPIIGEAVRLEISDEEAIADIQLRKLKENGRLRELTLDEIRKFDLLVKNKRLAKGDATTIEGKHTSIPSNPNELIKLASKKIKES